MKHETKILLLSAALAAMMLPAAAQTSTTPTQPTPVPATRKPGEIQERKENQQDRIGEGVENGSLTAGEAGRLERQESRLNQEGRRMRATNGGKLTAADRAKLNRQQNRLSKEIYQQKHNAQKQNTNPKSEVGKRLENQQDRIGQGIENGSLTPAEAARLEKKEAAINHEVNNMHEHNGGKRTPAEKAKVNRQENRVSHQIYRDKHNNHRQHNYGAAETIAVQTAHPDRPRKRGRFVLSSAHQRSGDHIVQGLSPVRKAGDDVSDEKNSARQILGNMAAAGTGKRDSLLDKIGAFASQQHLPEAR